MYRKIRQSFIVLAAATAMASCMDELNVETSSKGQLGEVYFTASIAEQDFFGTKQAHTRAAMDERQRVQAGFYDLAIDGHNDIVLSVATLDGMFGKPAPIPEVGRDNARTRGAMLTEMAQKPMSIVEYARTSDGNTIVGEPYTAYTEDGATWGGSHIQQHGNTISRTLHAFYPESESYSIMPASGTVEYTTPQSAADQCDLLYAQAEQGLGAEVKEEIHLTFNHLLTAVRFKIGTQQLPMSIIKGITISGICTTGTYNFTNNSWNLTQANGNVNCALNFNVTGVENTIINGGESTFMLLPQQLTPNARVTIEYEDYTEGEENGTKTLTASLATANTPAWEAGQCITYTLMDRDAKSQYILDVEAPADFSPAGGTQAVNVLSYSYVEGVRTPMRWIVQNYSSDGGKTWMTGGATNVPRGMAISPTEGTSAQAMPISVTLFAADSVFAPHREFLRYKAPLGYDGDAFDLSRHDYNNEWCAQTTANCYVVDAPGRYRIPTAYGNAIVKGETNKAAYTDRAAYRHCESKNNYMTHKGLAITAPMIRNNGITLSRATLVWEDVQNLIDPKSIQLVDDGNAIEFEILPEHIDQGNAVIAAMDGNSVAWSWHIWVTDEKASMANPIEDQNQYGEQVDFMPLTLGWCSTSLASGQVGRDAAVRITMSGHLSSRASFRIHQNSSPSYDSYLNMVGNATYYNWGRKDPFPGAVTTENIPGSGEEALSQPKPFYQSGTDAASLGLHAELHVEYGSNIWALLGQGAVVGLNGFLTGQTIGNIANYLKNLRQYQALEKTAIEIDGAKYNVSEKPIATEKVYAYDNAEAKRAVMKGQVVEDTHPMGNPAKDIFKNASRASDDYAIEPYLGKYMEQLDGQGFYLRNAKDIPTHKVELINTHRPATFDVDLGVLEGEVIECTVYSLTPLGAAPMMAIGDFSGALLGLAGATANITGDVGFGAVIANASLFKGGTDWCKEMKEHGMPVNYGILHPNILLRDPISWVNHDGVGNLWNAGQTDYDEKNRAVVKSIYDPCPAGYCVPTARAMSACNDETTSISFMNSTVKTTVNEGWLYFPALGFRNFWSASEPGAQINNNINDLIMLNGAQGLYWTSSPAINQDNKGEKGAYVVHFRGSDSYDNYGEKEGVKYTPRVVNDLKLQQSYALPIRPVRER